MLLGIDEYPFHQITQPFAAVGTSDAAWNDGHYVCFADAAGSVCVASSVRLYPNNDVLDGFVCLRHDGRQYNVRLSRRLRPDLEHLGVGPLRLELVQPLKTVRLVLEAGDIARDLGVELDVTCASTVLPYLDPVEVNRVDGRLVSERATYEVTGRCAGWVRVAGTTVELDPQRDCFFRNHSWGVHPGRGGPRRFAAPRPGGSRRAPGVRHWALLSMPDHGAFFFADPSGRAASGKGAVMYADRAVPLRSAEPHVEFYDGGRRLRGGWFRLTGGDGTVRRYQMADLGWVYCQGGGYFGGFDDGLGQGVYRGDFHSEGEVWDVSDPTLVRDAAGREFEFEHAWAENFVRLTCDGQQGLAHYECVVIEAP
ncbi:MAG TPA: hypothetical protein VGJ44_25610 [Kribbellaceae bacterium]